MFSIDPAIDAREETKGGPHGYSGRVIPETWAKITLSVGCGERIDVYYRDDTAMVVRGQKLYGAETYLERGVYRPGHSGGKRTRAAIADLCERFARVGVAAGIAEYSTAHVRCCCCGAELTDPESRRRNIGPKCVTTFHGIALMRILGLPLAG